MLEILVYIVIAGVIVWLVNTLIPMDARFKMVFNVIVAVALFFFVLRYFGVLDGLGRFDGRR
jgi:hypothetical protein